MKLREVTLKILRHGTPHNQLLSPLTEYLALSGRREAASVRVEMEHRDILTYMKSLRYVNNCNALRTSQLGRLGAELGKILGAVPGLLSDLSSCSEDEMVHLRLISSAAELALLPFELIDAPPGFPGEGYPMSLQLELPLVITREVRGAFGRRYEWPSDPKVLFAAAAPPGVGSIPFDAHLLALTSSIEETGAKKTSDVLVKLLPRASLADIRRACEQQQFTHVHILAHGASFEESGQQRFGLVLHGAPGTDPVDIVSAERLAAALHPHTKGNTDGYWRSKPAVVSIASCDGGNVSQVVVPGGSVAHALHIAGVPLVVASQFPLTKRGSVEMTETLYTGLLGGEDPRKVLHNVRQRLRAGRGDHHDWASLVVYTSFPPDIEQQSKQARYNSAKRGVEAAMDRLDRIVDGIGVREDLTEGDAAKIKDEATKLLDLAERHARRLPDKGQDKSEALGMRASTQKRASESLFKIAMRLAKEQQADLLSTSIEKLQAARKYYHTASLARTGKIVEPQKGQLHWVLCQYLVLDVVLGQPLDKEIWTAAISAARMNANHEDEEEKAWALGTLAELELLRVSSKRPTERRAAAREANTYIKRLVEMNVSNRFIYYSTERQLNRYVDWWSTPLFGEQIKKEHHISNELKEIAKQMSELLRPLAREYKSN